VAKPDGTVTTYDYDRADRLTSIAVRKGATELLSYAYVYDRNGNRTEQVERNGWAPETTTYTYDDLHRLETVTYPDGRLVAYGYDEVGNRTSMTDANGHATTYTYDLLNRLTSVVDPEGNTTTYSYDAVGNRTSRIDAMGRRTNYE
jgi:YD repeat-containing protein